jgi:hypothetical protein
LNPSIPKRRNSTHRALSRRFIVLGWQLFLVLSLHGCVLALGPQRHISGAELPGWLEPLQIGSTEQEVVALYGPPSSRQARSGALVELHWTEVLRPRACRTYLFAIIPLNRDPRLTRQVYARLDGGQLVSASVTYLNRHGAVTSTESLIQNSPTSPDLSPNPSLQRTPTGRSPGWRR